MKISAPPPKLKLSQRDLASLVRSNAVPNFRPIEETLSAASQFDDSLIGQKKLCQDHGVFWEEKYSSTKSILTSGNMFECPHEPY